jgi:hypothetical protein
LILLFPFVEEGIFARTYLGIMFSIVLLVGAFAARQTRREVMASVLEMQFSQEHTIATSGITLGGQVARIEQWP